MPPSSLRGTSLLQRIEPDAAEEANLALERDAEPLAHAATGVIHQGKRLAGGPAAGVLDEVSVTR
jgi:hypothetical protein